MIGGVGEKIQTVVELAEDLYERMNELRARVEAMDETVEDTADRVERVEAQLAEQRALVEAIAEDHGIDVEAIAASVEAGGAETTSETEEPGASDETAESGTQTKAGEPEAPADPDEPK